MGPDDTKVLYSSWLRFGKGAVEDVTEQMATQTGNDSLTATVEVIRHETETVGNWNLEVETNRGQGIGLKRLETEGVDHGWGVSVETTLRAVVAHGDGDVEEDAPI